MELISLSIDYKYFELLLKGQINRQHEVRIAMGSSIYFFSMTPLWKNLSRELAIISADYKPKVQAEVCVYVDCGLHFCRLESWH